jgi:hypothetical protein
LIKKIFFYILDKIARLFFLFDSAPKKDDGYIYARDFLGKEDYGKEYAEIFKPVIDKADIDYIEIYGIKSSLFHDKALSRIRYCVENRFWGLLSFVSYDGEELEDNDYFNQPGLIVYLIADARKGKHIAIVKAKVKQLEVLAFYRDVKTSIRNFNERKLIYSKEKGFTSL